MHLELEKLYKVKKRKLIFTDKITYTPTPKKKRDPTLCKKTKQKVGKKRIKKTY